MKNHKTLTALAAMAGLLITSGTASGGVIVSSAFSGVTSADVSLSGLEGYGFFSTNNPAVNNGLFADGAATEDGLFSTISNQNASPSILTTVSGIDANLTEIRTALGAQTPVSGITFGGNQTYGAYGGFPGNAGDIWSLNFTDLAAGNYTVSFWGGHDQGDRQFDVEAALTGAANDTALSGAISGLGSTAGSGTGGFTAFRYDISFTADALDDLSLTFGSITGSGGGAFLSGYTVAVPEPSSFALLAGIFGLTCVMLRRRA